MTTPEQTASTPPVSGAVGDAIQHLVSEIVSEPVLASRDRAMSFVTSVVNAYSLPGAEEAVQGVFAMDDDFWNGDSFEQRYRPYNVVDGTLVIPVFGSLVNRMGYAFGRYATGYQYIDAAFERGMDDDNVNQIVFHHNSGGGMVAGCFELHDKIVSRRGEKPILAVVQDTCLSASYALASAADEVIISSSGWSGSVGVLIMHVEMSEMLKNWGINITYIHEGEFKVDGNWTETLSDTARKTFQQIVSKSYDRFVSAVANGRGMEESAVRNTEARVYDNGDSIGVGFADRQAELEEVIASDGDSKKGVMMTTKTHTQAQVDAAVEEAVAAANVASAASTETAVAAAVEATTTAERARASAVISGDNFEGRAKLAGRLLGTSMSAEEIGEALGDAAPLKAAPSAPAGGGSHFDDAMGDGAGVTGEDDDAATGLAATTKGLTDAFVASGGTVRSRLAKH